MRDSVVPVGAGFRRSFHHLAVEALDDGDAGAVVFNDDIGAGAVRGAERAQRFRGKAVEDFGAVCGGRGHRWV